MKNGMQVKKHLNTCMDVWTCMNACIDGWIYTEWFRLLFMFTASIMQDEWCVYWGNMDLQGGAPQW